VSQILITELVWLAGQQAGGSLGHFMIVYGLQWIVYGLQWIVYGLQWIVYGLQWILYGLQWIVYGLQWCDSYFPYKPAQLIWKILRVTTERNSTVQVGTA